MEDGLYGGIYGQADQLGGDFNSPVRDLVKPV